MANLPRRRDPPPFRHRGPPVPLPTPTPVMPTEAQFVIITKNLGIAPSSDWPRGRFADELHFRSSVDDVFDLQGGPANADDCKRYGITANEWHASVAGVLALAAWRYKCMLPLTNEEIEIFMEPAAPALKARLREILRRGDAAVIEALQECEADEAAAVV